MESGTVQKEAEDPPSARTATEEVAPLSADKLRNLPQALRDALRNPTAVDRLDLEKTGLTTFPESITQLINLETLSIQFFPNLARSPVKGRSLAAALAMFLTLAAVGYGVGAGWFESLFENIIGSTEQSAKDSLLAETSREGIPDEDAQVETEDSASTGTVAEVDSVGPDEPPELLPATQTVTEETVQEEAEAPPSAPPVTEDVSQV